MTNLFTKGSHPTTSNKAQGSHHRPPTRTQEKKNSKANSVEYRLTNGNQNKIEGSTEVCQ